MEDPGGSADDRCPQCGESLAPDDRFCPHCGTRTQGGSGAGSGDGAEAGGGRSAPPGDHRTRANSQEPFDSREDARQRWDPSDTWPGRLTDGPGEDPSTPGAPGSKRNSESKLRTAGTGVAIGVLGMILLVVGTIGAALLLSPFDVPQNYFILVGTSIGQLFGFAGLSIWYLRRRGLEWHSLTSYLGIRVPTLRDLGVVLGGYVAIIVALIVISIVAALFLPEPAQNQGAQTAAENPEIVPPMILMMLLIVGPCEELLYRGTVQNRIRENFDVLPGIAIASAIFASVHVVALAGDLVGIVVTISILFFPGMIFGFVYEYTGNLVVPALLHGIHNSILLSLILLMPDIAETEAAGLLIGVVQPAAGLFPL